jgi:type IV pilus assembly protein PilN
MPSVNLLPWRVTRRKRRQRVFYILIGAAVASTLLLMTIMHIGIARQIEYQQQRNQLLKHEIALLDQKITEIQALDKKKKHLLARMAVIQRLQASRPELVHILDALARAVPEGVQLNDLTQMDRLFTINGLAESNARVSLFMRNLDVSPWFQEPMLQVIELNPDDQGKNIRQASKFSLRVGQSREKDPLDDGKTQTAPGYPPP